jgi:hypothetical protein
MLTKVVLFFYLHMMFSLSYLNQQIFELTSDVYIR